MTPSESSAVSAVILCILTKGMTPASGDSHSRAILGREPGDDRRLLTEVSNE